MNDSIRVAKSTLIWVFLAGTAISTGACSGDDAAASNPEGDGLSGAATNGGAEAQAGETASAGVAGVAGSSSAGESGAGAAGHAGTATAGEAGSSAGESGAGAAGHAGTATAGSGNAGESGGGASGTANVPALPGSLRGLWLYESGAPDDWYSVLEVGATSVGESDGTYFAEQAVVEHEPASGKVATEAITVHGSSPPFSAGYRCYSVFEVDGDALTVIRAGDCTTGYFDGEGAQIELLYRRVSEADCRRPTLTGSVENGGDIGTVACAFDVTNLTYDCALSNSPSGGSTETQYKYANLYDFVWEAKAVGRQTLVEKELTGNDPSTFSYAYVAGRLFSETSLESVTLFSTWDDQDRPTTGTVSTATCAGIDLTYSYDDTLRVWEETYDLTNATGSCPGEGLIRYSTGYDAHGNTVEMHHWIGSPDESAWTFEVLSTALVCHSPS